MGQKLRNYDWLHLHHEDFTGQYSKFFLNYAGRALARGDGASATAPWRGSSGFANSPGAKRRPWPRRSRRSWSGAGSCSRCAPPPRRSTWRSRRDDVDIAAAYADGTPMDPNADAQDELEARARVSGRASGAESDHCRCTPTSTGTRSTRRTGASRSARSRCSTSAPRSIRWPPCWCRTTARSSPTSTASPRPSPGRR